MSDDSIIIKEKTTAPIALSLESNGEAIDLSSSQYVQLEMIDNENKVYRYSSIETGAISGTVIITTPSTGSITFTPVSSNIFVYQSSPYELYVKVFNTSTQFYAVPEGDPAEIKLTKEF